jgi:hypothetical protein
LGRIWFSLGLLSVAGHYFDSNVVDLVDVEEYLHPDDVVGYFEET